MRALAPLAALYGAALAAREAALAAGALSVWRLPRPIISIGNLAVGGTGKTPVAIWLAERLRERGLRPGVALRGYGGSYEGPAERVAPRPGPGAARRWGDEACLLAHRLPETPVAVGRERALAALSLLAGGEVDVVLLDDGFQHRRLLRDLDIVLLDARRPLGNGRLLPAGPLREPPAALRRAGLIALTRWGEDPGADRRALESSASWGLDPGTPLARCRLRPAGIRSGSGEGIGTEVVAAGGCVAFCGIARPASFRETLDSLGIRPRAFAAFRDHHDFSELERGALEAEAARLRAAWLLTTEKDAVRLDGWAPRAARLAVLRVEAEMENADVVLERVLSACGAGRAA